MPTIPTNHTKERPAPSSSCRAAGGFRRVQNNTMGTNRTDTALKRSCRYQRRGTLGGAAAHRRATHPPLLSRHHHHRRAGGPRGRGPPADGQAARLPPSYLDCCDKPSENGHAHPPPIHMNSTADRGHPKKSVPGRACIIPHHALHLPPLASPKETAPRRSRPPITSTAVQPPYLLAAAALALVLLPARAVAVENELHLEGRGGWESLEQGRDRERASKWARGERSV